MYLRMSCVFRLIQCRWYSRRSVRVLLLTTSSSTAAQAAVLSTALWIHNILLNKADYKFRPSIRGYPPELFKMFANRFVRSTSRYRAVYIIDPM